MSTYKYKSGAQKRKEREEAEAKKKKLPKITTFFNALSSTATASTSLTTGSESKQARKTQLQFTKYLSIFFLVHPVASSSSNSSNEIELEVEHQKKKKKKKECVNPESEPHSNERIEAEIVEVVVEGKTESVINYISSDQLEYRTDKGYYADKELTIAEKKFLVDNEPCRPLGPYTKNSKGRSFSSFFYTNVNKSGIKTERLWLCYSKILNKCYCLPCWLFGQADDVLARGSDDWSHLQQTISRHEQKGGHNESCAIFDRWKLNMTIDVELDLEIRREISWWRQVLMRVVDVTLTLASSNMPFRGHDESINSNNPGIFLSIITLLSKYDPVLQNLLENKKKNSVTYLSPTIQNEIINILGNAVKKSVLKKIKSAPFFSIIVDTTQDISKIDQLSIIVRYVVIDSDSEYNRPSKIVMYESFLGFFPVINQTGTSLSTSILDLLSDNELPIEKLRGQGYDGAANMSGIYQGVQAKISSITPYAPYVHCAAHNLNLVLNDSTKNVEEIRNFYDLLESVYVFFGHSIKRWALLQSVKKTKITIKKLTPTRWSSRHDALEALRFRYGDILKALSKIILISTNSSEITEARSLKNNLEKFETVFLIVFETKILKNIDAVSKLLQKKQQNIEQAAKLFTTTYENIKQMRDEFNLIKTEAVDLAKEWGTITEFAKKRISRPKRFFDEINNHHQIQTNEDWFKINVFFKTLDILIVQLKSRSNGLLEICSTFRVLSPELLRSSSLSDKELYEMGEALYLTYPEDISDTLSQQLISFRQCFQNELKEINSIFELTELILIKNYSSCCSFSEIITSCNIFLTIPVSVASAERSFSKLKLIKSYLRNTISQERLSALAMISIENDVARTLDIDNIVTNFANSKIRKKNFS